MDVFSDIGVGQIRLIGSCDDSALVEGRNYVAAVEADLRIATFHHVGGRIAKILVCPFGLYPQSLPGFKRE